MVGTVLSGHVINLRRRADRKARFLEWNGGHAVHWVWHDAVEPDQVDRADRAVVGADIDASDAEIATALSHRRQWLACVDSGQPRLIFEDDCCLRHGAEATLAAALAESDMVFLGCNADAAVVLELPDRLFAHVTYGNTAHGQPGYFDHFAHQAPPVPPPHLHRTYLIWGLLAYALSPAGAAKLLAECFPLRRQSVALFQQGRTVQSCAVDAMVNAALQRGSVRALACFPPVAAGPNGDSDLAPGYKGTR
ncbi:Glycosyltransferase family 25 (LPS biosynthesis protein) [Magnetospirillum gryphiswaldense MSR-1]|nr:Glycosyltransferase family 25 (LPS biosynthesis protein) [Magnetospirillum gryphiswaldense MSR-1]AVM77029.1 Glycosyltransferase family 25 (LPS biosynthesis protein) [Magnetospirillum gryphiswaldense]